MASTRHNPDLPIEVVKLMDAVLKRDLKMVEWQLREMKLKEFMPNLVNRRVQIQKAGTFMRRCNCCTPLFAAMLDTRDPHNGIIDLLLKEGADVNVESGPQNTVITESAKRDLLPLVKKFIDYGAKLNALDQDGFAPLHYAVKNNNFEMVKFIVGKSADVNAFCDDDGDRRTALHMSTFNGVSIDIAEFLIQNGANVDLLDENDETPLIRAVREDKVDVVKTLLSGGACVNIRNADSRTALHLAAASSLGSCLEIAELLINHGSYINARERYDNTPLSLCLSNNIGNRESSPGSLLIRCGSELNSSMVDDALAWAVTLENFDIVKLAIKAGFNITRKNWVGALLLCEIRERNLRGAVLPLRKLKNFQDFLKSHTKNPSPLEDICRIAIRNQLIHNGTKVSIQFPIDKLPLPSCMKSFLMFEC